MAQQLLPGSVVDKGAILLSYQASDGRIVSGLRFGMRSQIFETRLAFGG